MSRAIVCLLAAAWVLDPGASLASPTHPCDTAPRAPDVAELAQRLARSNDPDAWRAVGETARALAEARADLSEGDRACAAYVAGSAAFFLSADRGARRAHAARAVAAFALAERLAPAAMTGRQARNRLQTAWARLGDVPGWLTAEATVVVTVPPPEAAGAGALRLMPADPQAWAAVCPADTCGPLPPIALPRPAGAGGAISLRPGRYRVEAVGVCGAASAELTVERAGPLSLPPAAPCRARLKARDAADGAYALPQITVTGPDERPLDAADVPTELGTARVSAPGYLTRPVTLPPEGGAVPVALERCPVMLTVQTQPGEARLEGDGPGPWGKRVVRASKAGHGPLEVTIDVPRPQDCASATHTARLILPRPVTVRARGPAGDALTLGKLVIQGEPVDAMGFHRPPGAYAFQAMHAQYGVSTGRFEVTACPAGDCPPVVLDVRFERPAGQRGRGPVLVIGAGGLVMGLGVVAGLAAWQTHQDITDYTTKAEVGVGIDTLVDRRDRQALTADALLLTGLVTTTIGALWWAAEGE